MAEVGPPSPPFKIYKYYYYCVMKIGCIYRIYLPENLNIRNYYWDFWNHFLVINGTYFIAFVKRFQFHLCLVFDSFKYSLFLLLNY